jgi:hypothetical protein
MSAISALAQHAKSYPIAYEIDSYEEDGEVYDREKLGLRLNDPIFMNDDVSKKFESSKPFFMCVELFRRYFPLRRLHNWYHDSKFFGCDKHHISNPGKRFLWCS